MMYVVDGVIEQHNCPAARQRFVGRAGTGSWKLG